MNFSAFIISALLTSSAFATQTIYHNFDEALRGIAINNACITESEVQTIKATRNCLKLVPVQRGEGDDRYTDWVCQKWETAHLAYPRAFERIVCTEYANTGGGEGGSLTCVRTKKQTEFLPTTIKIAVVTSNGEYDDYPGVTKRFTFPACKTIDRSGSLKN